MQCNQYKNIQDLKAIQDTEILVLDTETTGLTKEDEILQFSAVWGTGKEAMNIYIKPSHTEKWTEAMKVNRITPEMLKNAPFMNQVKNQIEALLSKAKIIVGYNLPFDLGMLEQNGVKLPSESNTYYVDLMIPFAKVYGVWNEERNTYKWQKLITCAAYYDYAGANWHDSLADTKATLYCFKHMLSNNEL